jgi:DNA-directed RNA polymerase specialized sigma24 family protein
MSGAEYNILVAKATAKGPLVKRALQKRHFNADPASIDDAVEDALIEFSNPEKILNIRMPDKPYSWLLSTGERIYQHERRKQTREIRLDELVVEPTESDRGIESYEASEYTDAVFGMIHKRYSDVLIAIERDGFTFEEIAEREGKPRKAIYDRYENAKRKAKEAVNKLEPDPPPQKPRQTCLK